MGFIKMKNAIKEQRFPDDFMFEMNKDEFSNWLLEHAD